MLCLRLYCARFGAILYRDTYVGCVAALCCLKNECGSEGELNNVGSFIFDVKLCSMADTVDLR
jgi:hypothetical protein